MDVNGFGYRQRLARRLFGIHGWLWSMRVVRS